MSALPGHYGSRVVHGADKVHARVLQRRRGARGGRGRSHGCAVFQRLEGVQQDKIALFESKQGHVVALVHNGDEAPVALDNDLQRLFEVWGCEGRVRNRLNTL